jgi:hypothetical protein
MGTEICTNGRLNFGADERVFVEVRLEAGCYDGPHHDERVPAVKGGN